MSKYKNKKSFETAGLMGDQSTLDIELDYETENPIIKFSTDYYNAISHKTSMMMTGAGWSALC